MTDRHRPRRVRVVLADCRPALPPVLRRAEVIEQTEIGRELVRGLIRAQLAASLRVAGVALMVFGPLPVLFSVISPMADLRPFGVPLAWWVLGALAYPLVYLLARWHRVQAERIEQDFVELLGQD